MKLGGWRRLWIAVSAVLLVPFGLFVFLRFPDASSIPHTASYYTTLSAEAKAQLAPDDATDASQVRMPNNHVIKVRKGIELKRSIPLLAEYQSRIEHLLWQKRAKFIGLAVLLWVGFCGFTYCFGRAVGWVYRGFKSSGSVS